MDNINLGLSVDNETDETLSDVEGVLNTLGIRLRITEDTYKNFDTILNDIGGGFGCTKRCVK